MLFFSGRELSVRQTISWCILSSLFAALACSASAMELSGGDQGAQADQFLGEIESNLFVQSDGSFVPMVKEDIAASKYFLFIKGRYLCPKTRGFLPQLERLSEQIKAHSSRILMIYYSLDHNEDEFFKFTKKRMPWPALKYNPEDTAPNITQIIQDVTTDEHHLPILVLTDAQGHVLAQTRHHNNDQVMALAASKLQE